MAIVNRAYVSSAALNKVSNRDTITVNIGRRYYISFLSSLHLRRIWLWEIYRPEA